MRLYVYDFPNTLVAVSTQSSRECDFLAMLSDYLTVTKTQGDIGS